MQSYAIHEQNVQSSGKMCQKRAYCYSTLSTFQGKREDTWTVSPHISSEQVNLYNCGIYLYIRIYKHERVTKV